MKSEFPPNSTIILVHAAWVDGSCWSNVILPLKRRGLHVICAPLPMTSLSDDVAALNRVLERTIGALVLAGHAYSGAVIAAVREERVKSLVYIAGLAPDEGEPVGKVFYRDEPHPDQPKMVPDAHNLVWMPEDAFGRALAHKANTLPGLRPRSHPQPYGPELLTLRDLLSQTTNIGQFHWRARSRMPSTVK